MPGSWTTPDRPGARADAPVRVAFRGGKRVGVRDYRTFAAQWLACTIPCRRFADTLAGTDARLGADVDRYSFIVVDSHHLLLASLPAHSHGFWCSPGLLPASEPDRAALGLMHKTVTHNRCYATYNGFCEAVLGFLRRDVPNRWNTFCDSATDNFRIISPEDFRVLR